jgi:hypothetical protein
MKGILYNVFISLILAFLASGYASAQTEPVFLYEGDGDGVKYVSGGVGLEERTALNSVVKDYNLKLVFAMVSGEYLSNLMVVIQDAEGKLFLHTQSNGPWFLVDLPEGQYKIAVAHKKGAKVKEVEVGQYLRTVMFHWRPQAD